MGQANVPLLCGSTACVRPACVRLACRDSSDRLQGLARRRDAPTIRPRHFARQPRVTSADTSDIAARVLAGEVPAGARLIRWLEDDDPRGASVLSALYPHTGRARVVGITGAPGAGKERNLGCSTTPLERPLERKQLELRLERPFS